MKHPILILFMLGIVIGCETTNILPMTATGFKLEDDEKRLWLRSKEGEEKLDKSGLIYRDDELEAYINEIAEKILPPEVFKAVPFKILIIKAPFLNAFAMPNGVVYIHTGMLAKMENEAQLAAILGHEMTHFTHRHAIKEIRNAKNKSAFFTIMAIGLPIIGDALGAIGTVASVTGYSRELETEADREGFKLMINAGYDPQEAVKIFTHLKKEIEEEKIVEPFFFGTHPKIQERISNYDSFLMTEYKNKIGGIKNSEIFSKKTYRVILDNATLDLKIGRYKKAQKGIERYLFIKHDEAKAYYFLGEIYRQKAAQGDIEKAQEYYQKAISMDPLYPDPYKEIGMIYYKQGEKSIARKFLEKYLTLSPKAIDKVYIEELIKEL